MKYVCRAAGAVVESLENRTLLSGVPLAVSRQEVFGGTQLKIVGTPGNDQITVRQVGDAVVVGNTGGWTATYAGNFNSILIDAGAGNDSVVVDPSVTTDCVIYGGPGNNTLQGGSGNDRLYSGPGKNVLKAGAGDDVLDCIGSTADTLIGGAGRDSFWADNSSRERILNPGAAGSGAVHRVSSFYSASGSRRAVVSVKKALSVRSLPEPVADGTTYRDFSNHRLFASAGPGEDDVRQGDVGDCFLLSVLSSTAKVDPWRIRQSMLDMGDGTYVVQFTRGSSKVFVRVDGQLPTWSDGSLVYADQGSQGSIWVAVMEKAYTVFRSAAPSYAALDGGWMNEPYAALGAASYSSFYEPDGQTLLADLQVELAAGKSVTYGAGTPADGAPLLGSHAYTVDHFNFDATGTPVSVTLRNPWGVDGAGNDGANDGYVTLNGQQALDSMIGFASANV